jgi:F-type H+-transporting ATPase subunit a
VAVVCCEAGAVVNTCAGVRALSDFWSKWSSKIATYWESLSKKQQYVVIGVVVLLFTILLRIVFPMPTPVVEVAPEPLVPGFTNSMLVTLIVDVILIALAVAGTLSMKLVPRGLQNVLEYTIESLYNLFRSISAEYVGRAFPIVATIFLFVLVSNWFGLLPGVGSIGICHEPHHEEEHATLRIDIGERMAQRGAVVPVAEEGVGHAEESLYLGCEAGEILTPIFRAPSTDLNMTLALSLIAVGMVEYFGFQALGAGYLRKFFNFKEGFIMGAVGILEFISELARIPAFMFRLFGNIFAGEVLIMVMIFLLPLILPLPIYAFEVFVGFIQAFIFAVLAMAFVAIAVTPHSAEHGDESAEGHEMH